MKHLFLFSLLLQSYFLSAQVNKWHTIKLDSAMGAKIISKNHNYYFESIIDKRVNRSNIGTNVHEGKLYPLHFESDSAALELHNFLNKILPKEEGKKAIHAEINFFQLSEYVFSGEANEGIVYLDIDFFEKNENGEKKLICHYHGDFVSNDGTNIAKHHPERIYNILRLAFKKLDNYKTEIVQIDTTNFLNPSYIPQKGLYNSILDYRRNTPFPKKELYKVKQSEINDDNLIITLKGDSLDIRFLGYSNGKQFYSMQNQSGYRRVVTRFSSTNGRFFFLDKIIIKKESNNLYLPYMGGGFIGGLIVGIANTAINASNSSPRILDDNIILDLETGDFITFNSPVFQALLPNSDNDVIEYRSHKRKEDLIKVIQKVNNEYYINSLKH